MPCSSPYQEHAQRWTDCRRCELYERRGRVCLARGTIPCDVLLTGEAPGASEDVLGRPFVGPAGHLLDKILAKAIPENVRWALTNLVGCIPYDEQRDKIPEPPDYAIEACAPRLREIVRICKPRLIVAVGRLSSKWLPKVLGKEYARYRHAEIIHPAAILRADVSQQGLAIQRSIVTLRDACEELTQE